VDAALKFEFGQSNSVQILLLAKPHSGVAFEVRAWDFASDAKRSYAAGLLTFGVPRNG